MIPNARKFQPGQSGNPGGRPKGIAAKAREHGARALEVLVAALDDVDAKVRLTAANMVLDRGYGKPLTMTADVTNKIEDFDDESLDAAISALREAIGVAEPDGSGEAPQTAH